MTEKPWGIVDLRPPILPRGGTVRPGEKIINERGKEYPRELDYLNVEDAEAIKAYYGDKPRMIRGMFASDEIREVVDLGYKKWKQNNTIACRGDGRIAIDTETGTEIECLGEGCPMVTGDNPDGKKKCKRQITIAFLPIGDLEPLTFLSMAIHTFTSSSWKAINNTMAWVNLCITIYGRLAGIPWVMLREPFKCERETADGKKVNQVHYTIRFDIEKPMQISLPSMVERPAAFDECSEPSIYPQSVKSGTATPAAALPAGKVLEAPVAAVPDVDPIADLLDAIPEDLRNDICIGFEIAGRTEEQQLELLEKYKGQPEKLQGYLNALVDSGLQQPQQPPKKRQPKVDQRPTETKPAAAAELNAVPDRSWF